MRGIAIATAFLWPVAAPACDGELFFSCSFSGGKKAVEVCYQDGFVNYAFGKTGELSDLRLSIPVIEAHLTPWPGIGRTIWEELTLRNGTVSYTIHAAVERLWSDDADAEVQVIETGGIIVEDGERELARLRCDEGSIDFP